MNDTRWRLASLIILLTVAYSQQMRAAPIDQTDDENMVITGQGIVDQSGPTNDGVEEPDNGTETVSGTVAEQKPSLYLIDTVKVVVFGDERTDLITDLDINRPSLDGTKRSLEDLVLEALIYQDAAKYKMLPTDESIERHLMSVQREHNLSLDDLKNIFKSAGYSFEEGKVKFGIMSAVGQMLDFKIRSRLIVPEKDIEHYYKEHPVYTDETYELANAFIKREDEQSLDEIRTEIDQLIQTGASSLQISWSEPFWVKVGEIAQDRHFIKTMHPGQIAIASEADEGIELIKLMSKQERKLLSLEDRYAEIAETLRQPKYEELFNNYKQELLDNASLVYF